MASQHQADFQDYYIINPIFIFRWEESQNAHVLLYPEGVVKLNETAAAILKYCTGKNTVAGMIDQLSDQFDDADHDQITQSVLNFLEVSNDKGWIKLSN